MLSASASATPPRVFCFYFCFFIFLLIAKILRYRAAIFEKKVRARPHLPPCRRIINFSKILHFMLQFLRKLFRCYRSEPRNAPRHRAGA
ncbi:MAG: hypothetical protein IJA22_01540 [Clostridia bacterium]|nr:hypothetical protein [Clostridia bacterium]